MEIPGRTPGDVADLCLARRYGNVAGLRVRVSNERLRARYVTGPAASGPLLKARLLPIDGGTRLVGQIHWAAPLLYAGMTVGSGLLVGVMIMLYGIPQHQPISVADVLPRSRVEVPSPSGPDHQGGGVVRPGNDALDPPAQGASTPLVYEINRLANLVV
jgi:hypothetical protein